MNPKQEMKKAMDGVRYFHEGKYERVKQVALSLLRKNPKQPMGLMLMGYYAHAKVQLEEAIDYYKRSLNAKPGVPPVLMALAKAYRLAGNHLQALNTFQEVRKLVPDNPEIWIGIGRAQYAIGDLANAENSMHEALKSNPNLGVAYRVLGEIQRDYNKSIEIVEKYFKKAIEINQNDSDAFNDLGNCYVSAGDPESACKVYSQILEKAESQNPVIYSNWLFTLHNLDSLNSEELFRHHLGWLSCCRGEDRKQRIDFSNDPNPDRNLRIGFTSADFYGHSVFFFLNALFSNYDKTQLTLICFSDRTEHDEDNRSRILKGQVDQWHRTKALSTDALHDFVQKQQIDILVDLSGHTGNNRMPNYMKRCAPIQVTWLGYPDTTGLDSMDYRMVDEITDPQPWADELATETLYRIPAPFLCYQPEKEWLSLEPREELNSGKIAFGSFNHARKLNSSTVDLWCKILQQVPEAELVIKCRQFGKGKTLSVLTEKFRQMGIEQSRLRVLDFVKSNEGHMTSYNEMDVALDPHPYNGTTTSVEAMWMGVPLITKAGDRHSARVGTTLLKSVGLEEFIAHSDQEYIKKAVEIAKNRDKLLEIKRTLRERMLNSPLCDSVGFARKFEAAIREMWKKWCREKGVG